LTSTSITATSLKSPMSGTMTNRSGGTLRPAPGSAAAGIGAGWCGRLRGRAGRRGPLRRRLRLEHQHDRPLLTLSPSLTRISLTTPAWLDGISIEALSDSTVISDCSALTVSPGLTSSSITATSSKSPMSGT
jgi:hypothetical protein